MSETPTPPENKTSAPYVARKPQSFWVKLRVFITNFLVWWKVALGKVRTRLPESVNRKLPNDNILSGAIAALFILLIWAISVLSPGKTPEVATVPPAALSAPEVTAPEVATLPPAIEAPAELTAPSAPEVVETIPPPAPVPTPEQTLLAAIQQQVGELTSQYANGLIRSLQANFQLGVLTVKVSDDWYSFDAAKQDNVAADMWRRAQELDFRKLQVADSQDTLLARSPVVGSNMVILQRQAQ